MNRGIKVRILSRKPIQRVHTTLRGCNENLAENPDAHAKEQAQLKRMQEEWEMANGLRLKVEGPVDTGTVNVIGNENGEVIDEVSDVVIALGLDVSDLGGNREQS